jgi:hypothetical protein
MTEWDVAGRADLASRLASMAEAVAGCATMQAAGERIVQAAAHVVDAAAMAGLATVTHSDGIRIRAYTDAEVLLLEHAQSQYREGPGLAAASVRGREIITVEDMARERRWPRFASAATRLGIQSMVVCSLPLQGGGKVALNLHAKRAEAFDAAAVERAALFALCSSLTFANARLAENAAAALASRQAVGEATGILMERHRILAAEAFERLSRVSQDLNVKLSRVAAYVACTGADPAGITRRDLPRE